MDRSKHITSFIHVYLRHIDIRFFTDCSNTAKVYVADTYQIESPSYPNSPVRGQICTWRVIGSNQTWYRINIDELDFGDGQSCDNYLQIEDKTLCDNGSFNDVLVLRNYSVDIKFVYGKDFGGKGFKINVTGNIIMI